MKTPVKIVIAASVSLIIAASGFLGGFAVANVWDDRIPSPSSESGSDLGAQVEEVRKWAEDARREIEKSITDAERQLREINERLARSGTGVTQAAIEEARRAEQFLVETRRQGAEARVRIGEIEQEKILAIQIATEERTRDIVTRMRLEEVSLIGTVKQQLEAQTEVLKAEMDRQLREVGNNYAAREAIIRAYATKIREVEEQASGSFWDGFKRSIEKMGNSAATAFQMGGSLAHIFSDRLGDAFDAIIGKTKSVSAAFKSMANSILRDVARMLASRFVLGLIGSFFGGPAAASISQSGAEWIDRQRDAIQPFARGIQRRRQAGRPAADADQIVIAHARRRLQAQFLRQLGIARFHQRAAIIVKQDRRDDAFAVVDLLDKGQSVGVLFHIHPFVVDALLAQKLLGALAVAAPGCAVYGEMGM